MSVHGEEVYSNENEKSTSLQSKYTKFCVFSLKRKPHCTRQWSPSGVLLHRGDWLWKSKNILEGVCEFLQFLLFLFQKESLAQIKYSWILQCRGRGRERKMSIFATLKLILSAKDKNSRAWKLIWSFEENYPNVDICVFLRCYYLHLLCKGDHTFPGRSSPGSKVLGPSGCYVL